MEQVTLESPRPSWGKTLAKKCLSWLLLFLAGGFTFQIGFENNEVVVQLKARVAQLEKKMIEAEKAKFAQESELAGAGLPTPVLKKAKPPSGK